VVDFEYDLFEVCVPFIINQTPAAGGDHCHGPQRTALSGLWPIPSTESGPQPLLVTYNLSFCVRNPPPSPMSASRSRAQSPP
jgi:hypothetical protein